MRSTSTSAPWAGSNQYVRLLYALWSPLYDASIGWDPAFRANARRMIDGTVEEGDRVLDVGTGTGLLPELGARRASEWIGLDHSGSMLARAARKIARHHLDNVLLRWGDARVLPWMDGSFDAVVSSFVLPHFARDEKVKVLREMHRVLRVNGQLGLFLAQGEVAPLFSTRPELEADLRRAGFEEVQVEDRDDVYRVCRALRPR